MAFVYILLTVSGTRYIGSTINLQHRLKQHHSGYVLSTKNERPLRLLAFRELPDIKEAAIWEKKYKKSHEQLERDMKKCILRLNGKK